MENWENKIIKEKLDSLQQLPEGYYPDLISKWEIIEAGLPAQEKRMAPIFKWIAAAALVGITFCATFLFVGINKKLVTAQLPVNHTSTLPVIISHIKTTDKTIGLLPIIAIQNKQNTKQNNRHKKLLTVKENKLLVENITPTILIKTNIDTSGKAPILNEQPLIAIIKPETIKPAKAKIFQKDFVDEVLTMDKTDRTRPEHTGLKLQINKTEMEENGPSSPALQWKKSF